MKTIDYVYYEDAEKALLEVQKQLGGQLFLRPDRKIINGKIETVSLIQKLPHWGYLLFKNQDVKISIEHRKSTSYHYLKVEKI
jgi:hypothetical protein